MGNFAGGGNNKQYSAAQNHHQQNMNLANNAKNDLPPRFKKMMMTQQRAQGSTEEVSLRPPANSMVLKPKTPAVLPKSAVPGAPGNAGPLGPLVDAALPLPASPPMGPSNPNNGKAANNTAAPLPGKEASVVVIKPGSVDPASKGQRSDKSRKDKGPTKDEVVK